MLTPCFLQESLPSPGATGDMAVESVVWGLGLLTFHGLFCSEEATTTWKETRGRSAWNPAVPVQRSARACAYLPAPCGAGGDAVRTAHTHSHPLSHSHTLCGVLGRTPGLVPSLPATVLTLSPELGV